MGDFLAANNSVLVFIAINGVLAFSVYAVLVAGQLSLAQAGFASIAAYVSALLTIELGVPFPLVAIAGASAGAVAAAILGLPVLRLRGVFLAIATIGFGEMVRIVALNLDVTGGAIGLRPIPKVITLWQPYLVLALCGWFFWRLAPTRLGLGLAALRQDEVAARAMGVDIVRHRMFAFVTSGAIAGLSGVLYAHFTRFISPDAFGFERAVDGLLYAVVGGIGLWAGPILGGALITVLPEVARSVLEAGWTRPALNGAILLGVILFLPGGLVGLVPGRAGRRAGDLADQGSDEVEGERSGRDERRARVERGDLLAHLDGVGKEYGGVKALQRVGLEIHAGDVLGLIGPNGAGKTTLVNILTGLTPPTHGRVEVLGTPTGRLSADKVTRLGVGRTFQQVKLFSELSLLQNVLVGAHAVATPTFLRRLLLLPSARRDETNDAAAVLAHLGTVGLAGRAAEPAGGLAYGDRRRLEIARALASDPALIVLDEPAAGMNAVEAAQLGELITQIAESGISILLIEHNVRLVMQTCTRIAVLDFGELIAEGAPDEIARDPAVIRAYLGADEQESVGLAAEGPARGTAET